MANPELLNAVRAEAESFLSGQAGMWHVLNERVADELAPLIADLVQQQLVAALQQNTPDARLAEAKAAIREAVDLYTGSFQSKTSWDDYAEDVVARLGKAGEALPEAMPPRLTSPAEAVPLFEAMQNGCEMALRVFRKLQSNPLLDPTMLAYPIDQLETLVGEVPLVEP